MQTCHGSMCWLSMIGMYVGWWLVASALLTLTWNRVISALTKFKPVVYWQTLLLVATMSIFVMPRAMWRYKAMSHHCCSDKGSCHKGDCPKGECPRDKK